VSYIGRVTHQKGPTYFIEAAYRLLQRTNSLRFVMAGDGDLLDMAKALVSALGMEGQFEFPGFLSRDQVIATLGRTDVYVMPSVSEPFGIGAIEAILAGVPVVVSEHAGVAEVIDQVVRIDPEDTDAIADAVWFLLEHPADRQAMVTSAIQQAEALSWQRSAQVLLDVYRALLSTI
jgi:glycosyltransferase involved in cell wall biosynthesis